METLILLSYGTPIACADPVYYARRIKKNAEEHFPSHLVVRPLSADRLAEICYVQLLRARVPVLVSAQPDGCIWIGGAYLDTIAREHRLIPRPLPHEMEGKTKEWLEAVGDHWQMPDPGLTPKED